MELGTRINTQAIQREAVKILYAQLNTMIAARQPTWTAEDDQYWAAMGKPNPDWTVETIAANNFHSGAIQSLINADINRFPMVSCIAYDAQPKRSSDDVGELYSVILAVEVIVKSIESEEEVNARIQNTLEACHLVFFDSLANRTLNNSIPELEAPRQTIGDVFPRRFDDGRGEIWYWQGGRLEYTLDKYVNFV